MHGHSTRRLRRPGARAWPCHVGLTAHALLVQTDGAAPHRQLRDRSTPACARRGRRGSDHRSLRLPKVSR